MSILTEGKEKGWVEKSNDEDAVVSRVWKKRGGMRKEKKVMRL
jgi:hypothetical protein